MSGHEGCLVADAWPAWLPAELATSPRGGFSAEAYNQRLIENGQLTLRPGQPPIMGPVPKGALLLRDPTVRPLLRMATSL